MQKKINYIIWGFVVILIIIFGVLFLINKDKIKEFKFTTNNPYNIDIRIYLKDKNKGKKTIDNIKKIKVPDEASDYIDTIINNLKDNKIDSYLIQAGDDVLVGNHYDNSKYKVATYYKDNSLFKIFDVINSFILTENYDSEEYDRIIMVGKKELIDKANNDLKDLELMEEQKESITRYHNLEVYWLKDNEIVTSLNNK